MAGPKEISDEAFAKVPVSLSVLQFKSYLASGKPVSTSPRAERLQCRNATHLQLREANSACFEKHALYPLNCR